MTTPPDTSTTAPAASSAPVEEGARLTSIDTARGFALLGIFLVNIQFFGLPMGLSQAFAPPADEGTLGKALFFLVKCLCEWKIYGLFSILFGIGFALQQRRALERSGKHGWLYARRLLVLLVLGLLHAFVLWYGDILVSYAIAGFLLLAVGGWRAGTLAKVGAGVVIAAALLMATCLGGSTVMQSLQPRPPAVAESGQPAAEQPPPDQAASEATKTPAQRLWHGLKTGAMQQPGDQAWMDAEIEAYREGPFFQAFVFRAMTWLMMMTMVVFCMIWGIVGLFLLGAALVKSGKLESGDPVLFRRLLLLGACIGLPLCTIGVLLAAYGGTAGLLGGVLLNTLGSPLMSLGYLSLVVLAVNKGVLKPITGLVANAGRMALTNYLSQTLIATFVFYHWGLAQFGLWSREERILLVLGVWLAQVALSTLWLRFFRFGPMEWLWRSLTYLAPQKLLR